MYAGIQTLVQVLTQEGTIHSCRGIRGLHVSSPVLIGIVAFPQCLGLAIQLEADIARRLFATGPPIEEVNGLSCPRNLHAISCHAHADDSCRKVLVVVGDDSFLWSVPEPFASRFAAGDARYLLIPVYRQVFEHRLQQIIPQPYSMLHVALWRENITEITPAILVASDIIPSAPRAFISYRHDETGPLAMQLFDGLSRAGFETFLDSFRLLPGRDFRDQLRSQIADKGCVIVLESARIGESEWVRAEAAEALANRSALVSLHLPAAGEISEVDSAVRYHVTRHEMIASGELQRNTLERFISWVREQHDRHLLIHQATLHASVKTALVQAGCREIHGAHGRTVQFDPQTGARLRSVYLPIRAPGPHDIYESNRESGGAQPVVIGLFRHMDLVRRAMIEWVCERSGTWRYDEEDLDNSARQIRERHP